MSRPGIEPVTSRSPKRTLYQLSYRGRSHILLTRLTMHKSKKGHDSATTPTETKKIQARLFFMLVLQRISRAYVLIVFDCMQVCQMDGRTGPNQSAPSTYSGAVQSEFTLSHLRMNIPVEVPTMLQFYTNCQYFKHRKFPKYSDTQNICCNHSKI